MEFPTLGHHCALEECKQLDFLPFECDACHEKFCLDHRSYSEHKCTSKKPVEAVKAFLCPLCSLPMSIRPGENPNIKVEQHIASGCKNLAAYKTNKCSHPRCKEKDFTPILCKYCHKNHCLRHRFEEDHACKEYELFKQRTKEQIMKNSLAVTSKTGPFIVKREIKVK